MAKPIVKFFYFYLCDLYMRSVSDLKETRDKWLTEVSIYISKQVLARPVLPFYLDISGSSQHFLPAP